MFMPCKSVGLEIQIVYKYLLWKVRNVVTVICKKLQKYINTSYLYDNF